MNVKEEICGRQRRFLAEKEGGCPEVGVPCPHADCPYIRHTVYGSERPDEVGVDARLPAAWRDNGATG